MQWSVEQVSVERAVAVAVGFPLALLVLNEIIARRRDRVGPLTGTLRLLRNLLLPAAGAVLMVRYVMRLPAGSAADQVTQTVLWVAVLWVALAFVNDVVFGAADPGSWRANVPELLRDVVRSVLVGVGAAFIYSEVWGKELAGALTALGLGSLVIGLALQEPLGNVFSGLMLLFERPVALGDWIRVEDDTGKVVGMNWRAVNIETLTREVIIVPNSSLYKTSFSNLSRPTPVRTETIDISLGFDDAPNKVKDVLERMLRETPGVLADPPPLVWTMKFGESMIEYRAMFSVANQEASYGIRDEAMTRMWYALRRAGIRIPYPISIEVEAGLKEIESRGKPDPLELLTPHPRFQVPAGVSAGGLRVLMFACGEMLLTEGDEQDGLCLVVEGEAVLTARAPGGAEREIDRIRAGGFYGEHSVLAGQASRAALRAETDVVVVLFDLDCARAMIERSPKLAREVGEKIEQRRRAIEAVRRGKIDGAA